MQILGFPTHITIAALLNYVHGLQVKPTSYYLPRILPVKHTLIMLRNAKERFDTNYKENFYET